jgi:hypothetical protein
LHPHHKNQVNAKKIIDIGMDAFCIKTPKYKEAQAVLGPKRINAWPPAIWKADLHFFKYVYDIIV